MSRYSTAYQIEVRHPGLNKYRMIRGADSHVVHERAAALQAQWDEEWLRKSVMDERQKSIFFGKSDAAERTEDAQMVQQSLTRILSEGIKQPRGFDWTPLKDTSAFPESPPAKPVPQGAPDPPIKRSPRLSLLDHLVASRKRKSLAVEDEKFEAAQAEWSTEVAKVDKTNAARLASYATEVEESAARKAAFLNAQATQHETVNARAATARAGDEDGVNELLDLALSRIFLPDWINIDFEIDYNVSSKACVIDFQLPSPGSLPTLKEVKYIQSRNECTERHISESERNRFYDSVLYQLVLLMIWSIFNAETSGYLSRVTLNGWVDYVDRATGMDERSCIMSIGVNRDDLDRIELDRVDPKECFKSLKGVAASKLIGLAPVAPLERPRAADSRLIESKEVAAGLDASINIAAMDWQDFEHLVRQVFEHEYSTSNSEVRVTQASRDGGVDAIVFDPDPIKGGKIVIQAKRYTNTVDVGAVRDLYGTLMNEGATKGILVTTSQFGPDARKFAQGKPLTLIDGGHLLFLLERMGVAARINLREAKETLRAEA